MKRFGRLTVVEEKLTPCGDRFRTMAICDCDCGGKVTTRLSELKRGHVQSCGCLRRDVGIARAACRPGLRHGDCKSAEYSTWESMLTRCTNPKTKNWLSYGGRGITVCDRWRSDYANFIADMGRKPSPQHSIDRVDNNGNYEPGNCRWATDAEQRSNKRWNGIRPQAAAG